MGDRSHQLPAAGGIPLDDAVLWVGLALARIEPGARLELWHRRTGGSEAAYWTCVNQLLKRPDVRSAIPRTCHLIEDRRRAARNEETPA